MSTARRTVDLDTDVLREISSWLSDRDLFSAIKSCRAFRDVGLPLLFSRPCRASNKTMNFIYSLLFNTAPGSFQYLRTLYLVVKDLEPPVVPTMIGQTATLLEASTHLTALVITTAVLASDPRIPAVIRSLSLRRLEIVGPDISSAQDPSFFDRELASPSSAVLPSTFLEIPNTVEYLSFFHCAFRTTKTYPQITRYKCQPFSDPLSLAELVHMLPNLRVLEMMMSADLWHKVAANPQYLVPARQANLAFQQEHTAWRSLKCLKATSMALFSMAPQFKVQSLCLFSDLHHPGLGLANMVPYFRPLRLQHLAVCSRIFTHELAPFFAAGALDGLQRFDIDIGLHETRPGTATALLKATLAALFAAVRTSGLRMLSCSIHRPTCKTDGTTPVVPPQPLNSKMFAHFLLEAAPPTLACAKLAIAPECDTPPTPTYWTITRLENGNKQLGQVPRGDRAAVHAIDTLCLPEEAVLEWPCPDWSSVTGHGIFV